MSTNAVDNPQAGQGRPLPKKESDLFKNVVKHYEMKQYKKGVKASDTILKRFPNHGETLAMKGLTLNCMGKRDEAHALVKKGLMNDMRSHVCWHVYGLLHRSDRNYNEAIKAYKQALRIDQENLQILRDLSLLQIQMRDLSGFVVTRHTILTLKPNNKINWLSFALAKHLSGDLSGAVSVIDIYLGTLSEDSPELERGFESSELAMYRNAILGEMPDNSKAALVHLEECKNLVVDEGSWLIEKGMYQLKLASYNDAKESFILLFKRGSTDDYRVHSGYMCALLELDWETCDAALKLGGTGTVVTMMPLTGEQRQKVLDAYQEDLASLLPRCRALQRIRLTLLVGNELEKGIDSYCREKIKKGVPSLGSDLSALFLTEKDGMYVRVDDPVDVKNHPIFDMIVRLVDGYISSLLSCSKFCGEEESEESPSSILWAWYLRALLHEMSGEYPEAVALADKCLEHTPTAVDMYELKARLLKGAGDIEAAVDCLDKGRELDKQDRYINNQTTKYMLQAGREKEALDRISLFTRHEGNPEQNLYDMQCTWYELELAACLARKAEWGRSLKKYLAVEKHFEDFHEDQFDFHSYCIRKVTLRAYTDVLRFEDELWGQPYYGRAAEGIIRCYLHLHDNPSAFQAEAEPDYSTMTSAERKKAKAIARKKRAKAEKKAAEAAEKRKQEAEGSAHGDNGHKKKKGVAPVVEDKDPNGEELLKRNPLDECKKYVGMLTQNAPKRLSTWLLQYDVAIRRGKFLMALQALFKAKALDAQHSELFSRIVDFAQKGTAGAKGHPSVTEVIASETAELLGGKSVMNFVLEAAAAVKADPLTDLPQRVAVSNALVSTKSCGVAEAASLIVDTGLDGRGVSADTCRDALASLAAFGKGAEQAKEQWIAKVRKRFPMITKFS